MKRIYRPISNLKIHHLKSKNRQNSAQTAIFVDSYIFMIESVYVALKTPVMISQRKTRQQLTAGLGK